MKKSPVWYLKYLIDDLTGKDSQGRTANEKRAYSDFIIATLAGATILGALFTIPFYCVGAVPPGLVLARKVWLRAVNTF